MDEKEYNSNLAHNKWLRGKSKNAKRVVHNGVTYPSIRKFAWDVMKKESGYVYSRIKNNNSTLPDGSTFEILD
jgi:hypothetical protein